MAWRSRECGDGNISSNSPASKETSHLVQSKIEAPRVSGSSSVNFSHLVPWKRLEGGGVGWIGEQRNPTCLTFIVCKCKHIDIILYDIQIFLCDIWFIYIYIPWVSNAIAILVFRERPFLARKGHFSPPCLVAKTMAQLESFWHWTEELWHTKT